MKQRRRKLQGPHLYTFFRTRSFLFRMLVTISLAVCIPIIISSVEFISHESNLVKQSEYTLLQSTAQTLELRFAEYIEQANRIALKMQLAGKLHENTIAASVQSEIEGLEIIGYYKAALPFADTYGLFVRSENSMVYTDKGKYRADIFSEYVLGFEPEALEALLGNTVSSRFYPWTKTGEAQTLYIVPLRVGSVTEINRYCLFVINARMLHQSLVSILSDKYQIQSISSSDHQLIFSNTDVPAALQTDKQAPDNAAVTEYAEYLSASSNGANGFSVAVLMSKSDLYTNFDSLSKRVRLISILYLIICILLIAVAVILNYRPIGSILKTIRSQNERTFPQRNELDYILNVYNHLSTETKQLSYELYERNIMFVDRVLENLLSGRRPSPQELQMLQFNKPLFYVAVAQQADIVNCEAIISANAVDASIYSIEMYYDQMLVFVCSGISENDAERAGLAAQLHTLAGADTKLGFSNPCGKIENLYTAYCEARRALQSDTEQTDVFAVPAQRTEPNSFGFDDEIEASLAIAIKNGDPKASEIIRDTFHHIQKTTNSSSMQRYMLFHVIETCQAISKDIQMPLDFERLAQIFSMESLGNIQRQFLVLLDEHLEKIKNRMIEQANLTYSKVIRFINDSFSDPLFCLNDVADQMGISIFTASRLVKDLTKIGFRKYLNDIRVEHAKDLLLTTGLSIREIADQSGFASASYFVNVFRKTEGITPNQYRHDPKG